jgi:hypothetical protein
VFLSDEVPQDQHALGQLGNGQDEVYAIGELTFG